MSAVITCCVTQCRGRGRIEICQGRLYGCRNLGHFDHVAPLLPVRPHRSPKSTCDKPSGVLLRLCRCHSDLAGRFPADRKRPRSVPGDDHPVCSREVFLCARKSGAVCEPENVSVSSTPIRDGPRFSSLVHRRFLKNNLRTLIEGNGMIRSANGEDEVKSPKSATT
jgi:hypothetical protein